MSGAAALEFALVSGPALLIILAILEAGVDCYLHSALDNAAQDVARQIFTGAVQNMSVNGAAMTQATFIQTIVCPKLPAFLSCGNLIVNVVDFSETASPTPYYTYVNAAQSALATPTLNNNQTSFCLGGSGSYMMLQLVYPLPLFTSVFSHAPLATWQGQTVRLLFSTAAFRNEPFPNTTYSWC